MHTPDAQPRATDEPAGTAPRVKICCIANVAEAELALAHGADALGLVSRMPSGPGVIDERTIAAVAEHVGDRADTFLLTAHVAADAIAAQHARCGTQTLQLVDAVSHDELRRLRDAVPDVRLVQVVHVRGEGAIDEALAVAELVDALLLDSGNPAAATRELGGTGRTHDWALSRRIRDAAPVPVWLAGGLGAANVAAAIAAVRPAGIDLCSGVRTDGDLDAAALHRFMAAARATGRPTG